MNELKKNETRISKTKLSFTFYVFIIFIFSSTCSGCIPSRTHFSFSTQSAFYSHVPSQTFTHKSLCLALLWVSLSSLNLHCIILSAVLFGTSLQVAFVTVSDFSSFIHLPLSVKVLSLQAPLNSVHRVLYDYIPILEKISATYVSQFPLLSHLSMGSVH